MRTTPIGRSTLRTLAGLAVALAAAHSLAAADDRLVVEAGAGNDVSVAGIGWEIPLSGEWMRRAPEQLTSGLLSRIDGWQGRHSHTRIADLSVTPFMRYEIGRPFDTRVFVEAGIGAHLLSRTQINDQRQFSTAFQFGEFIGASARYGAHDEYSLGVRLQHVSNGGIKRPNDGLTYTMATFSYRF